VSDDRRERVISVRAGGPRATSDELRRAMLEGWGRGRGQEVESGEPDGGGTTRGGEERYKTIHPHHHHHPHSSSSSDPLPAEPTEAPAAAAVAAVATTTTLTTATGANEVDDGRHTPSHLHERTVVESEREGHEQRERAREQRDARLAEFQRVMRERYMNGEDDAHVDYRKIDDDQSLDDTWRREATQDAEDAWFDEDEEMEEEEEEGGGVDDFDDTL